MKTITPLTIFLRSSPTPRLISSHFILFYSINTYTYTQQFPKNRVQEGNGRTSQSFSSSSSNRNAKVSVWWDMGNCPIPKGVNHLKISQNITNAIRANGIKGPVTITAFGNVRHIPVSVQEDLLITGVSLKQFPGRKHAIFLVTPIPVGFVSSLHILSFFKQPNTYTQEFPKNRVEEGNGRTSHSFSSSSSSNRNAKVSDWWDMRNCPIPKGVNHLKISQNIINAIRANRIKGPVTITTFGNVRYIPVSVQEDLLITGVSLKQFPGGKDAAQRLLLADLAFWVSQNPPPAYLLFISGDKEYANILHRLSMINYNILLASPAPGVLCGATSIMWPWCDMVKGENISGKHYSEPLDGPRGSLYGHSRVPLEDPFADMEQPTCVQPEDSRLAVTGAKPLAIPKAVVSHIFHVVNSYPKGIDIVELQSELERNNLPLDENFFGYKKFSLFLKSLPTVVKLQSAGDGQIFVHSIHSNIPESVCQNNVSEPLLQPKVSGTLDKKNAAVPVNKSKGAGSLDQQIATEPLSQSMVPEPLDRPKVVHPINSCVRPSKISEANNGDEAETLIEELNGRKGFVTSNANEKSSLQVEMAPTLDSSVDTKEDVVQLKEGHSSSVEKNDTFEEVGFLGRLWRSITRRNNDSSDKERNNSSDSEFHSTKAGSLEKNLEEKSVSNSSPNLNESVSVSEKKEKLDSEENGMFGKIVKWCRFGKANTNSDKKKEQFSEEANQIKGLIEINEVFSKMAFWEDTLSFLQTKGRGLISQSKTREQIAQRLQKEGPAHLSSLSEGDLNHLVDLLISEKKWLEESTTEAFPFKLIQPAKKSAPSSSSHGSNGLSSLFASGKSSPSNTRVSQYHERCDGKKRDALPGVSSVECKKNPSGRSKSQLLTDCEKLVAEKLNDHPGGFDMNILKSAFYQRYGYDLDYQMLGYGKLSSLLASIPGVAVNGSFLRPSKRSSESIIPFNLGSEPVRKCKEDISDSKRNRESDGKKLTRNSGQDTSESVLHILDSFKY